MYVNEGENAGLHCQYSDFNVSGDLSIQWRRNGGIIWIYDSIDARDEAKNDMDDKFIRIPGNVDKEHAIQLVNANLEDEATYQCNVDILKPYDHSSSSVDLHVLGKYAIILIS